MGKLTKSILYIVLFLAVTTMAFGIRNYHTTLCTQYAPNTTDLCGTDNGTITIVGAWTNPDHIWDHNSSTDGFVNFGGNGSMLFNFSRNSFEAGRFITAYSTPELNNNNTIPDECMNLTDGYVKLRLRHQNLATAFWDESCYNGSGWTIINSSIIAVESEDVYAMWYNDTELVGNCSDYDNQLMNYTFYRAVGFTTTGDDKVNLSCTSGDGDDYEYVQYHYGIGTGGFCSNYNESTMECTGYIKYTGDWTNGYIYEESINSESYDATSTTYKNLTIPKLFLTLDKGTDIRVIDSNKTFFFYGASTLIIMSNLTVGKVSIVLNGGTQYFEFYNDQDTYYDENISIISSQDTYTTIRVQDRVFSVLSDAIVNLYELDSDTNTTVLVSRLYGNNEKAVKLNSNETYLARAYFAGYEQDNYFSYFRPNELTSNELVITMKETDTYNWIDFTQNYPSYLQPDVDYAISIGVEGQDTIGTIHYVWIWNSDPATTQSVTATSRESYTSTKNFFTTHDNLSVTVTADDETKTFYFEHFTREKRYETSYYGEILTSKFAFAIFFIIAIALSVGIQKRFGNYGQDALMVISSIMSFINLWMLLIAIPLIIGKIGKVNIGNEI